MIRTKVFGVNSSPKQRKGTRPRIHFLNIPELLLGSLKLVSASQLPNENDPSHSPFTRRVRKKLDFPLSLKATGLWRIFTQDNSPKEIFFLPLLRKGAKLEKKEDRDLTLKVPFRSSCDRRTAGKRSEIPAPSAFPINYPYFFRVDLDILILRPLSRIEGKNGGKTRSATLCTKL